MKKCLSVLLLVALSFSTLFSQSKYIDNSEEPMADFCAACFYNDLDYVKQRIRYVNDLNAELQTKELIPGSKESLYGSPLALAIKGNAVAVVQFLIERNVNVNAHSHVSFADGSTLDFGPVLLTALGENTSNLEIIKLLVEAGANVTETHRMFDKIDSFPLLIACGHVVEYFGFDKERENELFNIVTYLIEKGADVNHKVISGYYPLRLAIERNNKRLADLLIKHGARILPEDEEIIEKNRKKYFAENGYNELLWGSSFEDVHKAFPDIYTVSDAKVINEKETVWAQKDGSVERYFRFYRNKLYWVRVIYPPYQSTYDSLYKHFSDIFQDSYSKRQLDENSDRIFGYTWGVSGHEVTLEARKVVNMFGAKVGESIWATYYCEKMEKLISEDKDSIKF